MEHVRVRGAARTGAGVRGTGARGDACDGPCDAVDAGAAGVGIALELDVGVADQVGPVGDALGGVDLRGRDDVGHAPA